MRPPGTEPSCLMLTPWMRCASEMSSRSPHRACACAALAATARRENHKMIPVGPSAYSRIIDCARMGEIAAYLWQANLLANRLIELPLAFLLAEGVKLQVKDAAAQAALDAGLGVNAGHDLTRDNLAAFVREVPGVLEVSIGHALIADALELGYTATVQAYLDCIAQGFSVAGDS